MIKKTTLTLLASAAFLISSCGGEDASSSEGDKDIRTVEQPADDNGMDAGQTHLYGIPAPSGLFRMLDKTEERPTLDNLNPVENRENYTTSKAKALNFGVYCSDLLFLMQFSENLADAKRYMETIYDMSAELGVETVMTQVMNRVKMSGDNLDSLRIQSDDAYRMAYEYLEQQGRETELYMMATGGWVEGMYLITQMSPSYDESSSIPQEVAFQEQVLSDLISAMQADMDKPEVQELMEKLTAVQVIFLENVVVEEAETTTTAEGDNKFTFGGGEETVLTAEGYQAVVEAINNLRNEITNL